MVEGSGLIALRREFGPICLDAPGISHGRCPMCLKVIANVFDDGAEDSQTHH